MPTSIGTALVTDSELVQTEPMWPFSKRREQRVIEDPQLGTLQGDGRTWRLELPVDGARRIEASVLGELTPDVLAALRELRTRIATLLRGPVRDELLELEQNAGRTPSPEALDATYPLDGVTLTRSSGRVHLEFGFQPSWSADHYVTVHLENWERAGSSIDS